MLDVVGHITPVVARILVGADVEHFKSFQTLVVLTSVDYFGPGEIKLMLFVQDMPLLPGYSADKNWNSTFVRNCFSDGVPK